MLFQGVRIYRLKEGLNFGIIGMCKQILFILFEMDLITSIFFSKIFEFVEENGNIRIRFSFEVCLFLVVKIMRKF